MQLWQCVVTEWICS